MDLFDSQEAGSYRHLPQRYLRLRNRKTIDTVINHHLIAMPTEFRNAINLGWSRHCLARKKPLVEAGGMVRPKCSQVDYADPSKSAAPTFHPPCWTFHATCPEIRNPIIKQGISSVSLPNAVCAPTSRVPLSSVSRARSIVRPSSVVCRLD